MLRKFDRGWPRRTPRFLADGIFVTYVSSVGHFRLGTEPGKAGGNSEMESSVVLIGGIAHTNE